MTTLETERKDVQPTEAQKKAQRRRSIALALCLVAFVVIFYVATLVKFGPAVMDRAL